MPSRLTEQEKAFFDTILQATFGKDADQSHDLVLSRMTLGGKDVAVVMVKVWSNKVVNPDQYDLMPLALVLDDETTARLRDTKGRACFMADPTEYLPPAQPCEVCGTTTGRHTDELCFK